MLRMLNDHARCKRNGADGLSLRALVALCELAPAALLVVGSRAASLDERLAAQQHAPWFMRPPAHEKMGRAWHDNSEATELSSLCWLLPSMWTRAEAAERAERSFVAATAAAASERASSPTLEPMRIEATTAAAAAVPVTRLPYAGGSRMSDLD